jgi:hypothetical protein
VGHFEIRNAKFRGKTAAQESPVSARVGFRLIFRGLRQVAARICFGFRSVRWELVPTFVLPCVVSTGILSADSKEDRPFDPKN